MIEQLLKQSYETLKSEIRRRDENKYAHKQHVWSSLPLEFWEDIGATEDDIFVTLDAEGAPRAEGAWSTIYLDLPGDREREARIELRLLGYLDTQHNEKGPSMKLLMRVIDRDTQNAEDLPLRYMRLPIDPQINALKITEAIIRLMYY